MLCFQAHDFVSYLFCAIWRDLRTLHAPAHLLGDIFSASMYGYCWRAGDTAMELNHGVQKRALVGGGA